MIDSHCHLDHEPLINNINDVLLRAKSVGIKIILTISTTSKNFNHIKTIINLDKIIYGTFGIHPHETETDIVDTENILKKISIDKKLIGVGETGLDFFYNHSNKKRQIESFENHIDAAIKLNIPIIVHSRNAENETFDILKKYKNKNIKILMHCFTGSYDFFKKLNTLNSFFSASGIITFKNSLDLQNTFKNIPNNKILVETDSPYLAPIPMRGKKNEPSFIVHTIKKMARLKNVSEMEIVNLTTNNFKKLFFNSEN